MMDDSLAILSFFQARGRSIDVKLPDDRLTLG
jgi:hypothetical protein